MSILICFFYSLYNNNNYLWYKNQVIIPQIAYLRGFFKLEGSLIHVVCQYLFKLPFLTSEHPHFIIDFLSFARKTVRLTSTG